MTQAFHVETIVALVAFASPIVVALLGGMFMLWKQLSGVSKAVNHVKPGEQTLYQMTSSNSIVLARIDERLHQQEQWRETYEGGPLDDGEKVKDFVDKCNIVGDNVERIQTDVKELKTAIQQNTKAIAEHGCPQTYGLPCPKPTS